MGYPRKLRSQANAMGSDGQFNFSAAGGTNMPTAIGAINDSIRQSAKDNAMIRKEMEDAEQHDWRVANANDSYQAINDLDPESDDYLAQLSDLDPRVTSLPGVASKLQLQGQLHAAWKAEDTKRKENEETMWEGMFNDARKFGTRDDVDALNEMRKDKSLGYEDARKFLGGQGGVYENKDKFEAKGRSDAEYENSRLKTEEEYARGVDRLDKKYKGKLGKRDALERRIAAAEIAKDTIDAAVEVKKITAKEGEVITEEQKQHRLDKTLERLREELENLGLKDYDDAMDALDKGRDDFYAPEGKANKKASVDAVFN